jgi:hypothetical protein
LFGSSGSTGGGSPVSCGPSTIGAGTGQTVTWFASAYGDDGTYLYSWNGTDGLSGNTRTVSKTYATAGEKFGILTVTSGRRQITVSCGSTLIRFAGSGFGFGQERGLGASCYATTERAALGESVTWLSIITGATASTTFAWDGADGLAGDRPIVSRTYTSAGNKFAMLTATDGKNRIIAPCTNFVAVGAKAPATPSKPAIPPPSSLSEKEKPVTLPVQALCIPSSAKTEQGSPMIWHAAAVGGVGEYRFSWFGDETLSGEGATTSKKYETTGVKRASVTVVSGDKAKTVACYPIEIAKSGKSKNGNGLSAGTFFSKITGPIGFALAAIVVIVLGIFMAMRRRSKDEKEEEERDHVA